MLWDIPASWCLPEHRVGCSKQGWSPAWSPPPADQAGEATPCAAGKGLLIPAWRSAGRGHLPTSGGSCFPAPQHWKTTGVPPLCPSAPSAEMGVKQSGDFTELFPILRFQNKCLITRSLFENMRLNHTVLLNYFLSQEYIVYIIIHRAKIHKWNKCSNKTYDNQLISSMKVIF